MMMNLFSMFDPSISSFNMFMWIALMLSLLIIPFSKFKKGNFLNLMFVLLKELTSLVSLKKMSSILSLLMIFLFIFLINYLALFPFIFSTTAHASTSFFMALTFWVSFMIFSWMKNTKNTFIHLLPTGTPIFLMNFMVLIELISNIIRPITLSVRLTANMVAGHLLMSLLANLCSSSFMSFNFISVMYILTILEIAVSIIQGYVFMTLLTLYSNESL